MLAAAAVPDLWMLLHRCRYLNISSMSFHPATSAANKAVAWPHTQIPAASIAEGSCWSKGSERMAHHSRDSPLLAGIDGCTKVG